MLNNSPQNRIVLRKEKFNVQSKTEFLYFEAYLEEDTSIDF